MTLTARSIALAILLGVGVAVASALSPAREAMLVAPVDAMSHGRREYTAQMHKGRDLVVAILLALRPPWLPGCLPSRDKPLFGYLATVFLIVAAAYAIPALVSFLSFSPRKLSEELLGVEGLLASRSLAASLNRTSVLVAALSTAIAMMVSVGIMVGSFRQTVVTWMDGQLTRGSLYSSRG